jgi:hypothetical protein
MAKTTPSGRAKSKTKAPKKKPTQLDRIERSIGLIESKLATLNAWETLNEAMSNDKLASPTVAVEEKWVPKDLSYVMITDNHSVSRLRGTIQVVDGYVNASGHIDTLRGQECGAGPNSYRKPTPEEIAAHEAKVKAEAQAAEDAKLVFGARVEHISRGKGIWMGMDGILHELAFLNHGEGRLHQWSIVTCPRLTFTLLP